MFWFRMVKIRAIKALANIFSLLYLLFRFGFAVCI